MTRELFNNVQKKTVIFVKCKYIISNYTSQLHSRFHIANTLLESVQQKQYKGKFIQYDKGGWRYWGGGSENF